MNIVISVPGDDLSTYTNNIGQWIVDDVVTEPTGSEAPGASYLVAAAGTGKFSGYSDNITILNASQGWIFIPPESEMRAISKANNTEYQYLSGSWVTVEKPNTGATLFGRGPVSSISNDPDGTPTVGMRRLVGTSPTGAWTGYANQVAEYFSDGWHYSGAATDGQFVYVQDVRRAYTWQTSPGAWKERSGKSFRLSEFATVAAAVTFIAAFSAPRPRIGVGTKMLHWPKTPISIPCVFPAVFWTLPGLPRPGASRAQKTRNALTFPTAGR